MRHLTRTAAGGNEAGQVVISAIGPTKSRIFIRLQVEAGEFPR